MPPSQYETTAASSGGFCCPQQRDGVCLLVGAVLQLIVWALLPFPRVNNTQWVNGRMDGHTGKSPGIRAMEINTLASLRSLFCTRIRLGSIFSHGDH